MKKYLTTCRSSKLVKNMNHTLLWILILNGSVNKKIRQLLVTINQCCLPKDPCMHEKEGSNVKKWDVKPALIKDGKGNLFTFSHSITYYSKIHYCMFKCISPRHWRVFRFSSRRNIDHEWFCALVVHTLYVEKLDDEFYPFCHEDALDLKKALKRTCSIFSK